MRSMTGYGAGASDGATARVSVEIRGVNLRFLDVKVTLPREYAAWESEIRERVRGAVVVLAGAGGVAVGGDTVPPGRGSS